MTALTAFHGQTELKVRTLAQLQAHHDADEIVKGQYWKNGKGCAIGCTLHNPGGGHEQYEPQFGIPQMLARLEDAIFEGLPNGKAKGWPLAFMAAIEPGRDLSRVGWQFLCWLLTDETVNPGINHPIVKDAVRKCADVLVSLTKGEPVAWSAAWSAARSAESARSAAWSAARSAARSAESARSAWSAAYVLMSDKLLALLGEAPVALNPAQTGAAA